MRSGRPISPPPRAAAPLLAAALALAAGAAACSSAFDGTVYRGEGFAFRIAPPPASWTRIVVSHAALAYRDEDSLGTIAVDARCGGSSDDVPLASLTQHLFIGFTEREILDQQVVPFDGREAMHTVLAAKLDGVPQKFDVWVMKKDGCVHDLYYLADPARFDRGAAAFQRFVHGFATVPPQ
jgi:hypothetical protein